jgi:hypothetical protein
MRGYYSYGGSKLEGGGQEARSWVVIRDDGWWFRLWHTTRRRK